MHPDEQRAGAAGDERLDRRLDDALRGIAAAPGVDLRDRVLTAIARHDEQRTATARRPWLPAVAYGGAAVLVLAVVATLLRGPGAPPRHGSSERRPIAALGAGAAQSQGASRPSIPNVASARPGAAAFAALPSAPASSGSVSVRHTGRRRASVEPLPETVDARALGPHLPGAPAGDLGDPIQPLPPPPSIPIVPITQSPIASAPLISDVARPVTEFPADGQLPESRSSDPGTSGGTRR